MTRQDKKDKQIRSIVGTKTRAESNDDDQVVFSGLAAPYDGDSLEIGWFSQFIERIEPGAFKRTIEENTDVFLIADHDMSKILARSGNGANTLTLEESPEGLSFRATPPDTQLVRDTETLIGSNHVQGVSIGFYVRDSYWKTEDGTDVHVIQDLDLVEISIVANPAYPQTNVSLRSMERTYDLRKKELQELQKRDKEEEQQIEIEHQNTESVLYTMSLRL